MNSKYNQKLPLPVTAILDAFVGNPAIAGKGLTTSSISTPSLLGDLETFSTRADSVSAPWAYINWIFFDEQFKYVGGGFDRVKNGGGEKSHALIDLPSLTAPKNGYVFVYCSNESSHNVYFDNLQVFHNRGPILEETHYYPFGLTMAGISFRAMSFGGAENKYKYNGIEQNTDFDLNIGETFFRSHDPQIGRWWQIDPKPMEDISLYTSMNNNPILNTDLYGDTTIYFNSVGKELMRTTDNNKFLGNAITVIPDANLEGFDELVGVMEQLGVDLNGGIATFMLRATGESYDVQSAFDLVDANANNYITDPEFVPRDGKGPLIGEASAPVENNNNNNNNVWTVRSKDIDKQNGPGASQKFGGNITIHTHDNEGRLISSNGRNGRVESGSRSADNDKGLARNTAGTGRFEMAVGKKSLYFYNQYGTFITVNRDVFAPKYFKKK